MDLQEKSWTQVSFKKIPANQVTFETQAKKNTIIISVNASASPLIYKLPKASLIESILVKGVVEGKKNIETGRFDEDSILRFGLVVSGTNRLTGIKKLVAADWVKKLFSLVEDGKGLDKIFFYNISNRSHLYGTERVHPKSNLMWEKCVQNFETGTYEFNYKLPKPLLTEALWISVDGDDTHSNFVNRINEIKLNFAEKLENNHENGN